MNKLLDFHACTLSLLTYWGISSNMFHGLVDQQLENKIKQSIRGLLPEQQEIALSSFYFECKKKEIFLLGDRIRLIQSHQSNISRMQVAMRVNPFCAMDMKYCYNPDSHILVSPYEWEDVFNCLTVGIPLVPSTCHYFFRLSCVSDKLFFEAILQNWDKLIIDISQHHESFSGHDLYESILEADQPLQKHEVIFSDVSEFLLTHSIYFNSLLIID